uniref:Uncharacterized protein n=1 Tax=Cacopsylla melanoneura TaxID=428564 RepID=A0A8D8TBM9_9HEMI
MTKERTVIGIDIITIIGNIKEKTRGTQINMKGTWITGLKTNSIMERNIDTRKMISNMEKIVPDTRKYHSSHESKQPNETDQAPSKHCPLVELQFERFRRALNKLFSQFIEDEEDLWNFVKKYEQARKKKLEEEVEKKNRNETEPFYSELDIPLVYDQVHNINIDLNVKDSEMLACLEYYDDNDRRCGMTNALYEEWKLLLRTYLDFKQKEKFATLTKIRETQHSLPVAQYNVYSAAPYSMYFSEQARGVRNPESIFGHSRLPDSVRETSPGVDEDSVYYGRTAPATGVLRFVPLFVRCSHFGRDSRTSSPWRLPTGRGQVSPPLVQCGDEDYSHVRYD